MPLSVDVDVGVHVFLRFRRLVGAREQFHVRNSDFLPCEFKRIEIRLGLAVVEDVVWLSNASLIAGVAPLNCISSVCCMVSEVPPHPQPSRFLALLLDLHRRLGNLPHPLIPSCFLSIYSHFSIRTQLEL